MPTYKPVTTVPPNMDTGKDKLKELIAFLESDIKNKMVMDEYVKKQEAEKIDNSYRTAMLADPGRFGYPSVDKNVTSQWPAMTTSQATILLDVMQKQAEETQKSDLEKARTNALLELYKNDPDLTSTITTGLLAGKSADDIADDIEEEKRSLRQDRRMRSNQGGGGGGGNGGGGENILQSQAAGRNKYNQFKHNKGRMVGKHYVRIGGADANPTAYSGKFKYDGETYYRSINGRWYHENANHPDLTNYDGSPQSVGIPDDIKKSLADGISEFQDAIIAGRGKDVPAQQREQASQTDYSDNDPYFLLD